MEGPCCSEMGKNPQYQSAPSGAGSKSNFHKKTPSMITEERKANSEICTEIRKGGGENCRIRGFEPGGERDNWRGGGRRKKDKTVGAPSYYMRRDEGMNLIESQGR